MYHHNHQPFYVHLPDEIVFNGGICQSPRLAFVISASRYTNLNDLYKILIQYKSFVDFSATVFRNKMLFLAGARNKGDNEMDHVYSFRSERSNAWRGSCG